MLRGIAAHSPSHPGIRNAFTSYYLPTGGTPVSNSAAVSANVMYALPFLLPGAVIDRVGIDVTTGAAGAARLGIYRNSGGMPTSLILDCGTVDTTNIAIVEASFTALTLPNEWVWVVGAFNATPGCRQFTNGNAPILGAGAPSSSARGLQVAFTYAALPDPAPTMTGFSTTAPVIFLRKS